MYCGKYSNTFYTQWWCNTSHVTPCMTPAKVTHTQVICQSVEPVTHTVSWCQNFCEVENNTLHTPNRYTMHFKIWLPGTIITHNSYILTSHFIAGEWTFLRLWSRIKFSMDLYNHHEVNLREVSLWSAPYILSVGVLFPWKLMVWIMTMADVMTPNDTSHWHHPSPCQNHEFLCLTSLVKTKYHLMSFS